MTGIELIAKERQEQIEKHGFTPKYDAENLPPTVLLYAVEGIIDNNGKGSIGKMPQYWSDELCKKILGKSKIERLAIAGALIAAAIDCLQYIEENQPQQ